MTARRRARPLLLVGGAAAVGAALVWWGLAFWTPVTNAYLSPGEAGRCLVADSSLCRLAMSLCSTRHIQIVTTYSPLVLWMGAAMAFVGLSLDGAGHRRGTPDALPKRRP